MSTALWSTSGAGDMEMRLQQDIHDYGQRHGLPCRRRFVRERATWHSPRPKYMSVSLEGYGHAYAVHADRAPDDAKV